jgi:hypothetical protein
METTNTSSSLSPEESLKIISEMITRTKEEYSNNSFFFLLWGYLISFACILHFGLIRYLLIAGFHSKIGILSAVLWVSVVLTGIIIQYVYIARIGKLKKVKTYIGEFMALNWQVNGLLIIVAGLFCWKYNIQPSPFILAISGAATFISGVLIKHRPFITGSLFMLIISIATLWINNEYQLLLTALAIILGYLLPGYSLKTLKK